VPSPNIVSPRGMRNLLRVSCLYAMSRPCRDDFFAIDVGRFWGWVSIVVIMLLLMMMVAI
jgi:hypothetical protein